LVISQLRGYLPQVTSYFFQEVTKEVTDFTILPNDWLLIALPEVKPERI
jgi:hypothetical protein